MAVVCHDKKGAVIKIMLDTAENKTEKIEIRLKKEQKKVIKELAADRGMKVSEYVLYCIMREIAETELYKKEKKD